MILYINKIHMETFHKNLRKTKGMIKDIYLIV